VAQKAETCFMCGHQLNATQPRRFSLPLGDLLLIVVILGVVFLWWTRSPREDAAATAAATTTPEPAAVLVPAATPPTAPVPEVVASPTTVLTATLPLSVTGAITPPVEPTPTPVVYTVVSGDTVEKIASRYGVDVPDLMRANDMASDFLQVDQKLLIPVAGAAESSAGDATPTATPTPVIYTVVRGDTVEKIASRYGVTVKDLMDLNDMRSDLIQVDQELVIPSDSVERGPDGRLVPTATPTPKNAVYKVEVRAGETLEKIAERLGSTVDAIIAANDWIESADTVIIPGDQLIVPVGDAVLAAGPVASQAPTATPIPLPTATPGPRWPAPQPLHPVNGAVLEPESVLLQWLSVGVLNPNEVYVVRVWPEGRPLEELVDVTLATSYRVPQEWLSLHARRDGHFEWEVQVARDVRSVAGQALGLRPTSPLSPSRMFRWEIEGQR
jgi:LysM repeat protein